MSSYRVVAVASSEETRSALQEQLSGLSFVQFEGVCIELSDAVQKCQSYQPDVIIAELTDRELDAGLFIQAISMNPENPCVIFTLHKEMDLDVFKDAIRQGAKEFIQYPKDEKALETALTRHLSFLSKIATQNQQNIDAKNKPKEAKLISVFASKGGSGTSTIAINLAHEIHVQQKKSVALLDLDQFFCNTGVMLNLKPDYSVGDLAQNDPSDFDQQLLNKITVKHDSGIDVVVGSKNVMDDNDMISPELLDQVMDMLVNNYEYVIVDLPSHVLDPYHQYMVERSDEILLVSCPDVPSLYRTRQYLDLAQKYLDVRKLKLILNRYNLRAAYGIKNEELEQEFRYDVFCRIPNDWELNVEANSVGSMLSTLNPKADIVKGIQQLSNLVTGATDMAAKAEEDDDNGLLGKLFGGRSKEQKGIA